HAPRRAAALPRCTGADSGCHCPISGRLSETSDHMNSDKDDKIYFLLVDDLKENLIALEALLRRDALTILKASSGTEALELLLHYDVALAFIDVQMPDMDGFELAEFMRGMDRTRAVPIIFLTAGIADKKRRFRGYEA